MNKYLSEKYFPNKYAKIFSWFLFLMPLLFSLFACMGCEPEESLQQSYNKVYIDGEPSIAPYKIVKGSEVIYAGCLQPNPSPPKDDPSFELPQLNKLHLRPIPGCAPDLPPGLSAGKDDYNYMVLAQLKSLNPKVNLEHDTLENALISTIMKDPQSTRKIQTEISGNYKCRAVLFSGKSVDLVSVELSGGVYCLEALTLRNGARVIEDSKAIGEARSLLKSTPFVIEEDDDSYLFPGDIPIPCSFNKMVRRTQLYNYREASVPQNLRNADFKVILENIKANPNLKGWK